MALRLLLVEDDPFIQRLYENIFSRAGFIVTLAKDGTIVKETIMVNLPDIIVMDVMMPNFNGLVTLEEIKSNPKTASIPVVMLSANNDPRLIDQALQLGAKQYLVKGELEPPEIVKIIKQAVKP